MCLKSVSKRKPKSTGFGYKTYSIVDNKVRQFIKNTSMPCASLKKKGTTTKQLRGAYNDVFYKLGKSYTAQKLPINLIGRMSWENMTYKPGFHIYRFLKDINVDKGLNIIVKVKYSKAHTIGKQKPDTYFNSKPCSVIVADKITLVEVVKEFVSIPSSSNSSFFSSSSSSSFSSGDVDANGVNQ